MESKTSYFMAVMHVDNPWLLRLIWNDDQLTDDDLNDDNLTDDDLNNDQLTDDYLTSILDNF